ncbi:MAG: glycosyltransferase family 4 protein [Bacteroidota bacterium]|nr:glycosyltransferase family 4 protein [Bacteroidota bacterium]
MKILQIIPGSGGSFYCGNCLRDSKYVEALKKLNHEVVKIPMYLPLFDDVDDQTKEVPVFYGAISIYLKQMSPFFRKAPKWFDRFLNSGPMLKFAAKMAGSTRATGLEDMTISMLLGEEGKQHEELDRMVSWIGDNCNPDIIHLSNALLNGIAPKLKQVLNVPIVCSLQDEDVWIDPMEEKFQMRSWGLMEENSEYIDAYISVSDYYSKLVREKMNIPKEKLFTLHLGVDPEEYESPSPHASTLRLRSGTAPLSDRNFEPPNPRDPESRVPSPKSRNIGFISRMCHGNGVDIMINAYVLLKNMDGFDDVKLIMTGGSTGDDKEILKAIRKTINTSGLQDQVIFEEDFEKEGRTRFFNSVSFISVPVRNGEAFGLYLLESMASGVPVIQPALGAFPEIIELSKGGKTYEPNTPEKIAETWADLLKHPEEIKKMGEAGRSGVAKHFNIYDQGKQLIDIYNKLIN